MPTGTRSSSWASRFARTSGCSPRRRPARRQVDVDLEAGDSPLDLAFDDADAAAASSTISARRSTSISRRPTSGRRRSSRRPSRPRSPRRRRRATRRRFARYRRADGGGARGGAVRARRAQTLDDDTAASTDVGSDSLAVTQESPTIERPRQRACDSTADAPYASRRRRSRARPPTRRRCWRRPSRRRSVDASRRRSSSRRWGRRVGRIHGRDRSRRPGARRQGHRGAAAGSRRLPTAADRDTDTREQPALRADDELLVGDRRHPGVATTTMPMETSSKSRRRFSATRTRRCSRRASATTR